VDSARSTERGVQNVPGQRLALRSHERDHRASSSVERILCRSVAGRSEGGDSGKVEPRDWLVEVGFLPGRQVNIPRLLLAARICSGKIRWY
jgi:hypothetical protein